MFALGKAISVLFMPCLSVYHFPSQSWPVLYKGFSYHPSQSQLLVLFAFLHFAMLLLSVSISTEILFTFVPPHPHTLLSTRIRKDLPSLVLNHSFLFVSHSIWLLAFSLSKLQWQIEVRLSSAGCFNFIDPPLEVTKAANCFCLWLKLCGGTHGSGI